MNLTSDRLSLIFSCVGHATMHLFAAFYFIIVLALEKEWQLPYHQLIELWTIPAILIGVGALPAGWLSDRWSAPGMITVMFFGLGASGIICSTAESPDEMLIGLSGIGLFASIYHPVGIAWVIRNAEKKGRSLGINGIFGSLGVALASVVAGSLIQFKDWQAAFWVPSIFSILIGLIMASAIMSKKITDDRINASESTGNNAVSSRVQAFAILTFTMLCVGLLFNSVQTALPKIFELRLPESLANNTTGIGGIIALIYGIAAFMQMAGGYLADHFPIKKVYITGLFLLTISLIASVKLAGLPLVPMILLAVFLNAAILPAENLLVAHFTPQQFHGIAYGLKFVITFGAGPLSVLLIAQVVEKTGTFDWLFFILAGSALAATLAATLVPKVIKTDTVEAQLSNTQTAPAN